MSPGLMAVCDSDSVSGVNLGNSDATEGVIHDKTPVKIPNNSNDLQCFKYFMDS